MPASDEDANNNAPKGLGQGNGPSGLPDTPPVTPQFRIRRRNTSQSDLGDPKKRLSLTPSPVEKTSPKGKKAKRDKTAKVIKTAVKAKVEEVAKNSRKSEGSMGSRRKKRKHSCANSQPKETEAMPTKVEVETPASGKRAKARKVADSVTSALARSATQGSLPSSTPKDVSKAKGSGTGGETKEAGPEEERGSTKDLKSSTEEKKTKKKDTEEKKKGAKVPKRKRKKTEEEKAAHARYMRFSRSLDSHPLS